MPLLFTTTVAGEEHDGNAADYPRTMGTGRHFALTRSSHRGLAHVTPARHDRGNWARRRVSAGRYRRLSPLFAARIGELGRRRALCRSQRSAVRSIAVAAARRAGHGEKRRGGVTCDRISMGAAIKHDYFGKRGTVTARVLPRPYILTKRVLFSLAFLSPRLPTPRLKPPLRLPSSLPPTLLPSLADLSRTLPTINGLHHMVAPASTSTHAPAQHQYGTRIRSNSAIKPSIRLRHSATSTTPTPRRIKPVPMPKAKHPPVISDVPQPEYPHFPLDHVMLHPDDANSKVFIAIGRCFMSVVSPLHA